MGYLSFFKRREKEMNDINENQGLKKKVMSGEIGWYRIWYRDDQTRLFQHPKSGSFLPS
jgi:hypothetical protein